MSLTKVTYSMIDSAPANVLDYGADPTGVTSSDAAFIRAQNANANILVPTGTFLLDNYRPKSGEVWHCAGYENTIIQLPKYVKELATNFTIQLTPIGSATLHYLVKVENNMVYIDSESSIIKASFIVYAERKDIDKVLLEYKIK